MGFFDVVNTFNQTALGSGPLPPGLSAFQNPIETIEDNIRRGIVDTVFGSNILNNSSGLGAMLANGIKSQGSLVDLQTRERLIFQHNPEEITDEQETGWNSIKVQGMSHPRKQWTSGGDRTVRFTLRFYRDSFNENEVSQAINWIQSLQLPEYQGNKLKDSPHRCLFLFGTLYNMTCIVNKASARYYELFSPATLQPVFADVQVELVQFVETGEDYSQRRSDGGGGGLVGGILNDIGRLF